MSISNYLDEKLVGFLSVNSRDEALLKLVDLLDRNEKLIDKAQFSRAIFQREKIVSTGIGLSVAIPHAKIAGYPDFFIAIGIQKEKGLEWDALDGLPVRLIFMIGGPENQQNEYLKILSQLTSAIKDQQRRKKLLAAENPKQVIEIFRGV